jgi:hypothetical protein
MKIKLFFLIAVLFSLKSNVDLIVFSFDRALQLYAFLESVENNVTGLGKISIIYRCSNIEHELSYLKVFNRFSSLDINPVKQSIKPREDFKNILIEQFSIGQSEYILMAVDDIIVTDTIDFNKCKHIFIEANKIYGNIFGFYLRLGKNIILDYFGDKCELPETTEFIDDSLVWDLDKAKGYWGYPNSVDFVIYEKSYILPQVRSLNYYSPNTFEGEWDIHFAKINKSMKGICFNTSKIINIPANLAQQDWYNFNMNSFSIDTLLDIFNKNLKINVDSFNKFLPEKCHEDILYDFVNRHDTIQQKIHRKKINNLIKNKTKKSKNIKRLSEYKQ